MSRYEDAFDTDWDDLDVDSATRHAYAIGVADVLGEDNRDHLNRLYEAMDTGYEKSVIKLAFEEGRKVSVNQAGNDGIWNHLLEDTSGSSNTLGVETEESVLKRGSEGTSDESDEEPLLSSPDIQMLKGMDLERPKVIDLPKFLKRRK